MVGKDDLSACSVVALPGPEPEVVEFAWLVDFPVRKTFISRFSAAFWAGLGDFLASRRHGPPQEGISSVLVDSEVGGLAVAERVSAEM